MVLSILIPLVCEWASDIDYHLNVIFIFLIICSSSIRSFEVLAADSRNRCDRFQRLIPVQSGPLYVWQRMTMPRALLAENKNILLGTPGTGPLDHNKSMTRSIMGIEAELCVCKHASFRANRRITTKPTCSKRMLAIQ